MWYNNQNNTSVQSNLAVFKFLSPLLYYSNSVRIDVPINTNNTILQVEDGENQYTIIILLYQYIILKRVLYRLVQRQVCIVQRSQRMNEYFVRKSKHKTNNALEIIIIIIIKRHAVSRRFWIRFLPFLWTRAAVDIKAM